MNKIVFIALIFIANVCFFHSSNGQCSITPSIIKFCSTTPPATMTVTTTPTMTETWTSSNTAIATVSYTAGSGSATISTAAPYGVGTSVITYDDGTMTGN